MPDTPKNLRQREPSPSDEVVRLLDEAVDTGHLTERGRRLILLHRIFSVPTRDVASVEGKPPATIRQYRNRAEAAVAQSALAVARRGTRRVAAQTRVQSARSVGPTKTAIRGTRSGLKPRR